MKKKIILMLLINLFGISSYGQYDWREGILVLKNGDTLVGDIRLPMISKNLITFNGEEKIKYRKDRKSEKTKYDESQVEKVIFKNSDSEVAYYEYVSLSDTKKGLFKIITKGKAKLYARSVSLTSSGNFMPMNGGVAVSGATWNDFTEFYILRENEPAATPLITARISRSFRKRAVEYFGDCPSLISKLETKLYNEEDILKIVEDYNKNCF